MAFDDEGLRLHHRLVRRTPRAEAVTMLAERWVPQRLYLLQDSLLNRPIKDGWYAKGTLANVPGLRDHHPADRLRLVAALQQGSLDLRPARRKDDRQLAESHSVHSRGALVAHYRLHCRHDVLRRTDCLHRHVRHYRPFACGGRRDCLHQLSQVGSTVHAVRSRKRRSVPASRCSRNRETSVLLVLSFNPLRGPFGPSADGPAYYAVC